MDKPIDKIKIVTNNTDSFHIYVYVPAGAIYETKRISGGSHMLEHMLFKNTGDYTKNISKSITSIGGKYNAVTSKDVTYFYIKTHINNYKDAIQIIHQIVGLCNFTDNDLRTERKVVLEEYNQHVDNAGGALEELTLVSLLDDVNVYRKSIIGEQRVLKKVTAKNLKEYYKSRYDRFTIFINCPVSKDKAVLRYTEKMFGRQEQYQFFEEDISKLYITDPKVMAINRGLSQYITRISYPVHISLSAVEEIHLQFVSYILTGAGLYSLLNHDVRELRGLVYTVHSFTEMFRYGGIFMIQYSSSNGQIEYITSIILSILHNLQKNGMTEQSLSYYKKSFLNTTQVKLLNQEYRSEYHGLQHFYGRYLSDDDVINSIRKIKNKDIKKICRKIFDFDSQGVVTIGNYSNPSRTVDGILNTLSSYKSVL